MSQRAPKRHIWKALIRLDLWLPLKLEKRRFSRKIACFGGLVSGVWLSLFLRCLVFSRPSLSQLSNEPESSRTPYLEGPFSAWSLTAHETGKTLEFSVYLSLSWLSVEVKLAFFPWVFTDFWSSFMLATLRNKNLINALPESYAFIQFFDLHCAWNSLSYAGTDLLQPQLRWDYAVGLFYLFGFGLCR